MRIALVTENFLPKLDGVTRTLAMLLEHLHRQGYQAIVLGPEGAPKRYAGVRVFGAPGLPLPLYPELRILFPPPKFRRLLEGFRPDLLHVADPMLLGAAAILWAHQLNIPVVSSYHTNLAAYCGYFHLGALEKPTWAYRRFLHQHCQATLCPSPSTAHQLEGQGFPRVGLWPRGVDGALFTPGRRSAAWRQRIAGDSARLVVLYVGRLSFEKNLMALVSAFTALKGSDTHLVLVGDGPARNDLQRALADHRATLTGYLRGEALAQAYASADLFAFPSITETFGQAVLEAMASGLPVVAYDAEGVRDLVRHGETGLLAPLGDDAAFTQALQALLASPDRRALLGARARHLAEQHTWENVMNGLLRVYQQVMLGDEAVQGAWFYSTR